MNEYDFLNENEILETGGVIDYGANIKNEPEYDIFQIMKFKNL